MTEEQINDLARYLGCEYTIGVQGLEKFDVGMLTVLSMPHIPSKGFELHLNPLSSLTEEYFDRMEKYLNVNISNRDIEGYYRALEGITEYNRTGWRQADWLRNNGYYLMEECIKPFVKLK